jgi:hypothetical protein
VGILTASTGPGESAVLGLLDESGATILDESGSFILLENGT